MKTGIIGVLLVLAATTLFAAGSGVKAEKEPGEKVSDAIKGMITAYQAKNTGEFMEWVSKGYSGETSILESNLRADFSASADMEIAYTVNNLTFSQNGEFASVALTCRKAFTSVKTGKRETRTAETSLVLQREGDKYKLAKMTSPALFSLE